MYAVIGSQVDKSDVEIASKVLETNFSAASQVSLYMAFGYEFFTIISVCINNFLVCIFYNFL